MEFKGGRSEGEVEVKDVMDVVVQEKEIVVAIDSSPPLIDKCARVEA